MQSTVLNAKFNYVMNQIFVIINILQLNLENNCIHVARNKKKLFVHPNYENKYEKSAHFLANAAIFEVQWLIQMASEFVIMFSFSWLQACV